MALYNRSVRRNNGKRLKSQMRGGQAPVPAVTATAATAPAQAAPAVTAVTAAPVKAPVPLEQNVSVDLDKQFLESLMSLNIKYPKLYNVMAQFNIADTDGNGDINVVEFAKLMTCLGFTYSPDVIMQLFDIADMSGDKTIDLQEFLVFHKSMMLFKKTDSDGSGSLDQAEFSTLMKELNVNGVNDDALFKVIAGEDTKIDLQEFLSFHKYVMMFKQADIDGSGSLTQEEYIKQFPNSVNNFTECNTNQDANLDIVEFITCMIPKKAAAAAKGGRGSSLRRRYTNKLRKSRNSYH